MKKIVLIGDSIRMGYDKYVAAALEGVAEVYYPKENCRFAENALRFAHEWKNRGDLPADADLVHWNVGLWDVAEILGDEPLTPLPFYENLIARLDRRFRSFYPNAKMVFATSTAVDESKMSSSFCRRNSVIEKYNEAAIKVLGETDTVINDLYSLTHGCPDEMRSDWVHFNNDLGTLTVGGRVLEVICKQLGISPKGADAVREGYTEEQIGR